MGQLPSIVTDKMLSLTIVIVSRVFHSAGLRLLFFLSLGVYHSRGLKIKPTIDAQQMQLRLQAQRGVGEHNFRFGHQRDAPFDVAHAFVKCADLAGLAYILIENS
jgi:hypothetical protein